MAAEAIIIWLIVGAVAGWLAGQIVKGSGFGLVGDIIVGIIAKLGISFGAGLVSTIATATAGAIVLLVLLRIVRR